MWIKIMAAGVLVASCALAANEITGDTRRGEQLFQTQHCVECHRLNGQGGVMAPDLGRRIDRDFTPAVMASLMWNHAPQMWAMMRRQKLEPPALSPEAAADLFAYFVSARYFEKPGDAARGKRAFTARHCAECHGMTGSRAADAPPVARWESLADPVALAQQMWNHSARMSQEFAKRKLRYPELSAQELTDILVYLKTQPEAQHLAAEFLFGSSDSGAALFQSKGCAACHVGRLALEDRLRNQTLTEIAVAMWNHRPAMGARPPLSQEEMRQILGYIWARQYFRGSGSAGRGGRVFAGKGCAACHDDPSSGAPALAHAAEPYSEITIVAVLWQHGPRMLERMAQKNLAWPRFTAAEMADVVAYLNSR